MANPDGSDLPIAEVFPEILQNAQANELEELGRKYEQERLARAALRAQGMLTTSEVAVPLEMTKEKLKAYINKTVDEIEEATAKVAKEEAAAKEGNVDEDAFPPPPMKA